MFDTRFERVAMVAGNLFFMVAIAFFVTLILLATGTVRAQEYLITDSLEPDALEEDTLEPDALEEDALGLESFDSELFRQWAQVRFDLPIAEVPPRPPQAIPMYFCLSCWEWHPGYGGGPAWVPPSDGYQRINGIYYPAVPSKREPSAEGKPEIETKEGEKK